MTDNDKPAFDSRKWLLTLRRNLQRPPWQPQLDWGADDEAETIPGLQSKPTTQQGTN